MKFIMMRCIIFMTLLAGFNNLCMESNEENNKEQSQLDNELKRVRQEKAAQYQREKEKKQKEAEQQKTKTRKKKKQEELPKAEPGRGKEEVDMTFEQRRAESKKIVERLLDAAGKEVEEKPLNFAEVHKVIEEERKRLQQEKQSEGQEFQDLSAQEWQPLFRMLNDDVSHALVNSPKWRDILSAQLLFIPFALSRGVLKTFKSMFKWGFIFKDWHINWTKMLTTFGLDHETVNMELNRLKIALAEHKDGGIEYLSITRNVDLIRVILFFATYTSNDIEMYLSNEVVIKKQSSDITGNERVPDGTTALMFAVGGGYVGIVKELLRRGANPFLMNNHGDNAFSIAKIQLERAKLHDDKFIKIYTRIQQLLLEESARKYVLHIAQLIRALQSERQVTLPNGTAIVVPGLPYDLVLPIALANLSTNEQRTISILLDQFPADRLLPAELTHAAPPVAQGLLSNSSAWIAALLSYYFSSANKS